MVKQENFDGLIKNFSSTNSGRPLLYIRQSKNLWKCKWVFIWLSLFVATFWSCALNLDKYLQFKTQVAMTFDSQSEIQFPAVSFCNQFGLSKAALGNNIIALMIYSGIFAASMKEIPPKFEESAKLCKGNVTSATMNFTQEDAQELGVLQLQRVGSRDSYKSVVKCWWKNVEIDTNGIFMNHFLDAGPCFTFMPKHEEAYNYIHSDFSKIMYGLNDTKVIDRTLSNAGPNTGLRLLLNVGQSDHCDSMRKHEGDGFRTVVHDHTLYKPTFSMLPYIVLNAGFEINIVLKPIKFVRTTANLGFCQEPVYYRGKNKYYFKTDCINSCFIREVIVNCHCYPEAVNGLENIFSESLGFNVSAYGKCDQNHVQCMKDQQSNTYRSENPLKICPECLEPCFETKYASLATYKKFPTQNSIKYLTQVLKTSQSVENIRKNYILVNFYLDSMTILTITESQALTLKDLIIFFGCKIGLFLGMSFMSLGEIGQITSEVFFLIMKKCCHRKKSGKRVIHIKPKYVKRKTIISNVKANSRERLFGKDPKVVQRHNNGNFKHCNMLKQITALKRWRRVSSGKVVPANMIFTTCPNEMDNRRRTIRDIELNLYRRSK